MANDVNTNYQTISESGEGLYKVKGSKHFGYAVHVKTTEDVEAALDKIKKNHHSARHVSYAWRLGADMERYRANDDGEPSNSAGKPILGQIEKYELTNALVAVVRYFGGTKLGVGGLIDAYRTAAELAIQNAKVITRQLMEHYRIHFEYDRMSDVMLLIRKNDWESYDQDFTVSCKLTLSILPEKSEEFKGGLQPFNDIRIEYLGLY